MVDGDEYDVLNGPAGRKAYAAWQRPGATDKVKRRYRRRERRIGKAETRTALLNY
jgi:hypothetical protein